MFVCWDETQNLIPAKLFIIGLYPNPNFLPMNIPTALDMLGLIRSWEKHWVGFFFSFLLGSERCPALHTSQPVGFLSSFPFWWIYWPVASPNVASNLISFPWCSKSHQSFQCGPISLSPLMSFSIHCLAKSTLVLSWYPLFVLLILTLPGHTFEPHSCTWLCRFQVELILTIAYKTEAKCTYCTQYTLLGERDTIAKKIFNCFLGQMLCCTFRVWA